MMNLSWAEKDFVSEVKAYHQLSIEYFYQGLIEKSEYYKDRYMRGKMENNNSVAK